MKKFSILIILIGLNLSLSAQDGSYNEERGEMYYNSKDYFSALSHLQNAAKGGSGKAMCLLADMYYYGKGVEKNMTIANNMLFKAIAKDHPMAYYIKGEFYYNSKDYDNAIKYLEIAASKKYYLAYETLGNLYFNGKDVPRDYKKAFNYFGLSAENGNEGSKLVLAFLYYDGLGVEKDRVKSQEIFDNVIGTDYDKLATKHKLFGQHLALLYYIGDGGKQSYSEAFKVMEALEENNPGFTDKELYKMIDDEANKIVEPSYPGGRSAVIKYVQGQIYAPAMKILRDNGTVIVSAIIDCKGRPYGTKIIQGVNSNLNTQAEKIIQRMPSWTPGTKGGDPIEMRVEIPVTFDFD